EAGHRALADHLARRGIAATVTEENLLGCRRVRYVLHGTPLVSIVLPTGGNVDRLAECAHGILETTAYRDFELILVDHSSGDLVRQFHEKVRQRWPVCQYVDCRAEPANRSALSNRGARYATGEYLLFLNEATAVLDRDWLTALLEQAQRTEVGAVGGKLLHVDDTIQHAGLTLGVCGVVGHVFRFFPGMEGDADCHHLPHVVRNCSAVSGACLMIRTALFREVGGFEEIHLPGAYQDVDLCLRLREQGRRIVYTPHARLYIHEPQGPGQPDPRETRYMQQRWGTALASDPYYNPNLTRRREDHGLDVPC
ncbi:MAG: glycosyltransferase, partial [Gemmataceae bacterium]|nr:glycosyltransferase [Gemmataceae bacterium]